jgi:hypothetical protein
VVVVVVLVAVVVVLVALVVVVVAVVVVVRRSVCSVPTAKEFPGNDYASDM